MLSIFVQIFLAEPKVYQSDFVKIFVVVSAHQDVVWLEIVEEVATIVESLDTLDQLKAYLYGCLFCEDAVVEVVFQSFSQFFLDNIRPNLVTGYRSFQAGIAYSNLAHGKNLWKQGVVLNLLHNFILLADSLM